MSDNDVIFSGFRSLLVWSTSTPKEFCETDKLKFAACWVDSHCVLVVTKNVAMPFLDYFLAVWAETLKDATSSTTTTAAVRGPSEMLMTLDKSKWVKQILDTQFWECIQTDPNKHSLLFPGLWKHQTGAG